MQVWLMRALIIFLNKNLKNYMSWCREVLYMAMKILTESWNMLLLRKEVWKKVYTCAKEYQVYLRGLWKTMKLWSTPREHLQNKKEKSRTTINISEFEDIRNNLCFFWDARQLESCLIPLNSVGKIYLIYGNI